jgi:hypothetical protein
MTCDRTSETSDVPQRYPTMATRQASKTGHKSTEWEFQQPARSAFPKLGEGRKLSQISGEVRHTAKA